jgi:Flp pilus assembly protein TadG
MSARVAQGPDRPRTRRRPRSDRGQALVEFALVAPVLLLLIFAIADFARAWNTYQVLTDAAREGARTAVIDDPAIVEADVRQVITDALNRASLDPAEATVQVLGFRSGRGNPATVRIEYRYQLGWIGAFVAFAQGDDVLTLITEIVMRNE